VVYIGAKDEEIYQECMKENLLNPLEWAEPHEIALTINNFFGHGEKCGKRLFSDFV